MLSYLSVVFFLNVFLLSLGRFRLVQKTGQACTALAFTLRRTTELLVALTDNTIKCFDKGRMVMHAYKRLRPVAFTSVYHSSPQITANKDIHLYLPFISLHRHKAAGELDARSRRSSLVHLCPQLRPLRHHHVLRHSSALGSGQLPEEEEAEHKAVCWHTEGKHTDIIKSAQHL